MLQNSILNQTPFSRTVVTNSLPRLLALLLLATVLGCGGGNNEMSDAEVLKELEKLGVDTGGAITGGATARSVNLSSSDAGDDVMKVLVKLSGVVSVNLKGSKVTDEGLATLCTNDKITRLDLGAGITDKGFANLKSLKSLLVLQAEGIEITDAGGTVLGELPKLRVVNLANTKVGDATVGALAKIEPLNEVHLTGTEVTDEGVAKLIEAKSESLGNVILTGTKVTEKAIEDLRKALPETHIEVGENADPTPQGVQGASPNLNEGTS